MLKNWCRGWLLLQQKLGDTTGEYIDLGKTEYFKIMQFYREFGQEEERCVDEKPDTEESFGGVFGIG